MHDLAVGSITGNKVTCVLEARCVHAACERSSLRAFVRLSVQVLTHFGFRSQLSRWAACNEIPTAVSRCACCNPSNDGCPGCDTKIPALVAKIEERSAAKVRR